MSAVARSNVLSAWSGTRSCCWKILSSGPVNWGGIARQIPSQKRNCPVRGGLGGGQAGLMIVVRERVGVMEREMERGVKNSMGSIG